MIYNPGFYPTGTLPVGFLLYNSKLSSERMGVNMIGADDLVEDLLEKYPGINRYLMRRGIICVQCGETYWGSLGDLIREKDLDVDQVLSDLNRQFSK
jgi:hypothetical protein